MRTFPACCVSANDAKMTQWSYTLKQYEYFDVNEKCVGSRILHYHISVHKEPRPESVLVIFWMTFESHWFCK